MKTNHVSLGMRLSRGKFTGRTVCEMAKSE